MEEIYKIVKKWVTEVEFKITKKDFAKHYTIKERLGEGRYGQVFKGVLIKDNQECALKRMRTAPSAKDRDHLKMIKCIQNPNLIRILDVFMDKEVEQLCIVTDFIA